MEKHKKVCNYAIIMCVYSVYGCTVEFKRSEEASHMEENSAVHLLLLESAFNELQEEYKETRENLKSREQQTEISQAKNMKEMKNINCKVRSLESNLKDQKIKLEKSEKKIILLKNQRENEVKFLNEQINRQQFDLEELAYLKSEKIILESEQSSLKQELQQKLN